MRARRSDPDGTWSIQGRRLRALWCAVVDHPWGSMVLPVQGSTVSVCGRCAALVAAPYTRAEYCLPARVSVPEASRLAIASVTVVLGSEGWNPAEAADELALCKAELTAAGPAGVDALVRLSVTLLHLVTVATGASAVEVAQLVASTMERHDASKGVS